MVTGLATINGAVYYFDDAGAMQTGIVEIGGVPYLFDVDGKMITDPAVLLQLQIKINRQNSQPVISLIAAQAGFWLV